MRRARHKGPAEGASKELLVLIDGRGRCRRVLPLDLPMRLCFYKRPRRRPQRLGRPRRRSGQVPRWTLSIRMQVDVCSRGARRGAIIDLFLPLLVAAIIAEQQRPVGPGSIIIATFRNGSRSKSWSRRRKHMGFWPKVRKIKVR